MGRFKVVKDQERKNYSRVCIDSYCFMLERSEKREFIQMLDNAIDTGLKTDKPIEISKDAYKRMIEEAKMAANSDDCVMCGS